MAATGGVGRHKCPAWSTQTTHRSVQVHPHTHPQAFPQRTTPRVHQTLPQVVLPGQTWSLQIGDIPAAVATETQLKSIIA